MTVATDWSLIVLTGGSGTRLGGADKAQLRVGDRSLLAALLDEVPAGVPIVVAGPELAVSRDVRFSPENPAGGGPVAGIAAAGTPYMRRHAVTAALGDDRVSAIALSPVAADGTVDRASQPLRIDCDALVIGHGLVPNCDVTRILGATHRYAPADGGWIAVRDGDMRTSIPGLYLAGDGGGISGAAAAALQGELAGLAAARDLGALAAQRHLDLAAPLRRRLGRAMRFGRAMAGLMVERPGLVASIPAETPVCRCEDVTRAEIDQAVAEGAREVNQVKAWTRCGMGPCQGRMCGDTVAAVVARLVGGRSAAGAFTARVPLRPVPTAQLIGSFDYADIPIPRPAPL